MGSISAAELEKLVQASVKMNAHEPDAELRAKMLFVDYKKFLRTRQWNRLPTENPKVAVGHICSLLKPPALKSAVENALSLGKYSLRKD